MAQTEEIIFLLDRHSFSDGGSGLIRGQFFTRRGSAWKIDNAIVALTANSRFGKLG
jgi:hypothetical protein